MTVEFWIVNCGVGANWEASNFTPARRCQSSTSEHDSSSVLTNPNSSLMFSHHIPMSTQRNLEPQNAVAPSWRQLDIRDLIHLHDDRKLTLQILRNTEHETPCSIFFCFDWVERRRRHGSVTRRKPHQYWFVCDYEVTSKQFDDTFHTHTKNNSNSLKNSQPQIPSKEAQASFCPSKTYHTTKRHNKMKGGPHPKANEQTVTNSREPEEPTQLKRSVRSRSVFSLCHSSSTVRERLFLL